MHGQRKLSERVLSAPSTTAILTVGDSNGSSFVKDGCKISVGDCALFKPPEGSPPFVGIIRCWTSEEESNLKLRVNWLYRPTEIKLLKGVALEAAPNELFYSFHSDEIPAASLLHPCRVAFLPKGVDLPSGISSFVCRRVYDITNKCLWWLTDQDYIDDQQEEVDQLLLKTRIEMHASVEQQGSRSPKPVNGSAASSLKHSPDSVQNSSSNISSHRQGKKRERVDQSFDVSKRERSSKPDDGDAGQLKSENTLNFEIARVSEKGGLTNFEDVARLVRLMQPEKSEKMIDLTARCMLAGVIAATDKFDCLNQFVQLRGLLVLNEWLQEVHKGKISDSGSIKNSDKSVDDFLLVLLRALDKLPVNLNALQMCNIGKSVNHLRSHKNSEIQKKARSLVDTWKKRVEAEMNIGEADRSQHESSHGAAIRSPITHHSSLKSTSVKHVPMDSNSKSVSSHLSGARSTLSPTSTTDNCKDGQSRLTANGGSSEPQIMVKEEKSSSSSQSHTNSQCSSEQVKNMAQGGREDIRRSTAMSKSLNKTIGTTKHRKLANGPSSVNRETSSNKSSSMAKNSSLEKLSQSVDASVQESNNQKIIVKIGNRGRGPTQSVVGSSLEDSSCKNSRDSSPAHSQKHDSQQFFEVDGSSASVYQKTSETKRLSYVSKIACSPSRTEMKSQKTPDSSFSPMNALIESCAKISEANVSMSDPDDVGMNLLASVATGEISKSGTVSPTVSPHRSSKMAETSTDDFVADQKQLNGDDVVQHDRSSEDASKAGDISKQRTIKADNLNQSVESCLKNNNGTLVEKLGTSARSVSDPVLEIEKLIATEESQNDLSVANLKVGGSLEVQDNVASANIKDEFETEVQRDNATCVPNDDDDEKKKVSQFPQSDVVLDQNAPASVLCDPLNTDTKPVSSETSNEVESEMKSKMVLEKETCASAPQERVEAEDGQILENKEPGPSVLQEDLHSTVQANKLSAVEEEIKEKSGPKIENVAVESGAGGLDMDSKLGFDLNEGFDMDEGKNIEPVNLASGSVFSVSCGLPASVTVASANKGPFVPPDDLLWNKRELGWKGSAATSAFRPAEPRKSAEVPLDASKTSLLDTPACKPARFPLDIDLNVADESSGQEFCVRNSSGGLDLDLNMVDEPPEVAHVGRQMASNIQRVEASSKRDFDLNDGPVMEDMPGEQLPYSQPNRGHTHIPFQQPLGQRVSTSEIGNCFPWYPAGNSYSVSVTPSALPDREAFSIVGIGGGPQHVLGGPTSALSFNPDAYRGSVLSSSPALPFHSAPFQYPVLPFGASFPLPTSALAGGSSGYIDPGSGGRISAIPSQLVGNPASVSFQYPHGYVVSRSMPDVGNMGVVESSHKWGKQALDLNSGPGSLDVEGRDESLPSVSRQVPTISSQSLVEEQARMYSMGRGHLKRKESEGGWNLDKFNFKQSPWR